VHKRWSFKRRSTWALIVTPILAVGGIALTAASPAVARSNPTHNVGAESAATEHFTVKPRVVNDLDCNGWSKKYASLSPAHRMFCTDPHGPITKSTTAWGSTSNTVARFVDNGHYVGHDEPSVKFISNSPNSGNTMTYYMKLPVDPKQAPTVSTSGAKHFVHYFELSPAPWFGLPICDPGSYPQNPCTPDSDSNVGNIFDPSDAGSAFMELQFYPPGEAPFADNISCSATKWCSAITIDSLESLFNFAGLNPNCEEPVNFAFLQRNGVPTGPPSPQLANYKTFLPNSQTLQMNSGDTLKVSITDSPTGPGITTTVTDYTTGKKGTMTASAANGFMNTNYLNCKGSPFNFHAEYNTANQQNSVPWAALDGGVLMEQETGHSEVCSSLLNRDPFTGITSPSPNVTIIDKNTYDTCVGGSEGTTRGKPKVGEGPCNARTGVCKGAETEGPNGKPIACPTNKFTSGALCEFADGFCFKKGPRTVTLGPTKAVVTSPIDFCAANRYQNGDLDFDGVPYQKDTWPNGSKNNPTSIRYIGPFDQAGNTYPAAEFETDIPGSEFQCNVGTGFDCLVPPLDANFYPYWTLTNKRGQTVGAGLFKNGTCTWNFGNTISGVTTVTIGGDAQYGLPEISRFGGTSASAVFTNPETTALGCGPISAPK
jgi:hypothetical protein